MFAVSSDPESPPIIHFHPQLTLSTVFLMKTEIAIFLLIFLLLWKRNQTEKISIYLLLIYLEGQSDFQRQIIKGILYK